MPILLSGFVPFLVATLFLLAVVIIGYFRGYKLTTQKQSQRDIDEKNRSLLASRRLNKIILESLDFEDVVQKIADTIPNELFFGTGVVAIIDENKKTVRRIAASRTKEAMEAIKAIKIPFRQIEIPLDDTNNLMVRAISEHKSFSTEDVYDVLGPVLSKDEARIIQEIMNTKTTLVYPIYGSKSKAIGVFIASTQKSKISLSPYELDTIQNFVDGVGIAMEHALIYQQLKHATEQIAVSNKKLQELDKLKDDFVSVASHELRTPMTAIRSYSWMALNRPDITLSEKMKKYLSRTLISTERLINLVNDMLNVSRIEAGRIEIRPAIFDVLELTGEVIEEVSAKAAEKLIHLEIEKDKMPQIFADPDKVHQVLLNLVGNSLKFTPANGVISINFFTDGEVVEIAVVDTGAGISSDDQSRLFKKFERLDSSYVAASTSGGTGLGLYISKSLIELMHGKIWAKSDGLGKGATFTFSLPIATPSVLAEAEKYTNKPIGDAKSLEPVAI